MKPEAREPMDDGSGDELLLGKSSWSDEDMSLKYGWHDKNGKLTRGGELPVSAIPRAVLFAASEGYLDRGQMGDIAKGLVDALRG